MASDCPLYSYTVGQMPLMCYQCTTPIVWCGRPVHRGGGGVQTFEKGGADLKRGLRI